MARHRHDPAAGERRRKRDGLEDLEVFESGSVAQKIAAKVKKSSLSGMTQSALEGWLNAESPAISGSLGSLLADGTIDLDDSQRYHLYELLTLHRAEEYDAAFAGCTVREIPGCAPPLPVRPFRNRARCRHSRQERWSDDRLLRRRREVLERPDPDTRGTLREHLRVGLRRDGLFGLNLDLLTLLLLFAQMAGTVTPLFIFPKQIWTDFPFVLTLEGQYIMKNAVLISAGFVIGATVRGGRLIEDPG